MHDYDPAHVAPSPQPRKRHILRWIAAIAGGLIIAIIAVSIATAGSHPASSAAAPATSQPAATASLPGKHFTPAATAPATAAPATAPASTAPAMTTGQQQAVTSAQGYLDDGQGFSQSGLTKQLTSSSGEGFPLADAQFAISYLHPDWYAQAVISAKSYLADGQGFSRSGLMQQLTSQYGEGFTYAQAQYAVRMTMGGMG